MSIVFIRSCSNIIFYGVFPSQLTHFKLPLRGLRDTACTKRVLVLVLAKYQTPTEWWPVTSPVFCPLLAFWTETRRVWGGRARTRVLAIAIASTSWTRGDTITVSVEWTDQTHRKNGPRASRFSVFLESNTALMGYKNSKYVVFQLFAILSIAYLQCVHFRRTSTRSTKST